MKVEAIKIIKTGEGKNGAWTLVRATLNGKDYTGFYYDKPMNVGDDVEVELYQEEYNGTMQDKFKLLGKKAQESKITEMAIKTEIARWGQQLDCKLDLILEKLEIKDYRGEVEKIRDQEVPESPF